MIVRSVFAGFEEAAAGMALALHRHHLAAEQRDNLGVVRSTERAPRLASFFPPPLRRQSPSPPAGEGGGGDLSTCRHVALFRETLQHVERRLVDAARLSSPADRFPAA